MLANPADVLAQRGRRSAVKVKPVVNIDSLLNQYLFEQALNEIQQRKETTDVGKQPLEDWESKEEQARIGANMITATAKVVFVDSVVVDKTAFLQSLRLNAGCGVLGYWKESFQSSTADNKEILHTTTYMNEFQDRMLFSAKDASGKMKLHCQYKVDDSWDGGTPLGLVGSDGDECNPYLLSDGMTMYYASNTTGGLGGYDIYVTRYNTDTKNFLKSENMGMPYNSPDNEYFMAIDETNHLGWLVTDRKQPEGKVCIYVFVPSETREVYVMEPESQELRHLAMIHDMVSTQKENRQVYQSARQRYSELLETSRSSASVAVATVFSLPIYNGYLYTSLGDFKSDKARQLAKNWIDLSRKRTALEKELLANRRNYSPALKNTIIKQEQVLEQLDDTISDLEWNIRYEEQTKLGVYK